MEITLNGIPEIIPENLTVTGLIKYFKEGDPDLMVEINRRYIFPKDYGTRMIQENDVIEFINPNLGG